MSEHTPGAQSLVLPGDLLGTAEEFVPGFGAYEDGGRVYAALLGHPHIDPQARAISVRALHAIPRLAEGDLVYARVDEIKSAMAILTIVTSAGSNRGVPGAPEGTVHISKARDGYTETLATEFGIGDLVLAKVLQAHPTIKLTTAATSLGVVAARCQSCHAILALGDRGALTCPRCGASEHRKVAQGYGALQPFAAEAPPHGSSPP
ncbi:MAG: exosome complex RNA-binding protein Csl4 [Thermoplasmata archaeon]